MAEVKVVSIDARKQHGTALIASDDAVWVSVCPSWWDLASWLWWWLAPADKKAWVTLRTDAGYVRTRAVRVAVKHVRISRPVVGGNTNA